MIFHCVSNVAYGVAHIVQGIIILLTIGLWNPSLAMHTAFYFAKVASRKRRER